MRFTIYCHTNRVNGKRYIGQTKKTMGQRWREHVANARCQSTRKGRSRDTMFWAAIRKYGPDAFDHEVLDVVTTASGADIAETVWIRQRRSLGRHGYNMDGGGYGRRDVSDEVRRKIRESRTPEQWREHSLRVAAMQTPEQHRERVLRGVAAQTDAQRRAKSLKAAASQTAEQRHVKALKRWEAMTPEERSAQAKARMARYPHLAVNSAEVMKNYWASIPPEERKARAKAAAATVDIEAKRECSRRHWEAMSEEAKTRMRELARSPESRSKQSEARRLWWANRTPEQRAETVRRREETKARLATESGANDQRLAEKLAHRIELLKKAETDSRVAASIKGWETRRARYGSNGRSGG